MRRLTRSLLAATLVLASASCLSQPDDGGGCPRAGETARRCKRLCVLDPARSTTPLPCACMAQCLCWQMSGHSRPVAVEDAGGTYR